MTILVTGAAKGLGAQICLHLAGAGHDLAIHYRKSEKEAQEVAEKCRALNVKAETIFGDFSTLESATIFIASYLARFPDTKGLVNNVGNYLIAPSAQTHISQWEGLFHTNFFVPILLTQALLPTLRVHKGCVVNIGVAGLDRGFAKATAYGSSKSSLTRVRWQKNLQKRVLESTWSRPAIWRTRLIWPTRPSSLSKGQPISVRRPRL